MSQPVNAAAPSLAPPPAFTSRNPLLWLKYFGPGAVIASLTIGAGELIFSSRAGALFGYRILWFFLLVLLFKWVLVYVTGRQMILTGVHPFARWMDLPGPRGWFPAVLFLLALACFPVWVGFHAGTTGSLISWLAGTEGAWGDTAHYVWGAGLLGVVMVLVYAGGYAVLEKVQLWIVSVMLVCCVAALVLVRPDWGEFLAGFILPRPLAYPDWAASVKDLAGRPVWVEVVTYVGVLGGSGYDYLAYVSYLRDKGWGHAGSPGVSQEQLARIAAEQPEKLRGWLRVLAMDSTLSFLAVLFFTGVFVACGAVILGPQHKLPAGSNLLALQASFVTAIHPWLKPVYFVGAFLTMFGTLYGTIEVAPTILREFVIGMGGRMDDSELKRLRFRAVTWAGGGGLFVVLFCIGYGLLGKGGQPPGLVALLTPANLFTGVLACGLICWLNSWIERRFLPPAWRVNGVLAVLNLLAGGTFLLLGIKAYADHSGWASLAIFSGTIALGCAGAGLLRRFFAKRP